VLQILSRNKGVMLQDSHNRAVQYLRLSLTKSCPMRCIYCRPETLLHEKTNGEMSVLEIKQLVGHLVSQHGLKKVRLTGGEPTSRPDLPEIVTALRDTGITEISLTTNGLSLHWQSRELQAAGLHRVNVSLDSLDRERFKRITGIDGLEKVKCGLIAAQEAGLKPLKINTVVVRGENDHELQALLEFATDLELQIRFIELMPMGPLKKHWDYRFVSEFEIRERLSTIVESWSAHRHSSSAARTYDVRLLNGKGAQVGLITAMSCNFCSACDRIRIGSCGEVFPCLMDFQAGTILPALRPRFDPEMLDEILKLSLQKKSIEHGVAGPEIMTHIGG